MAGVLLTHNMLHNCPFYGQSIPFIKASPVFSSTLRTCHSNGRVAVQTPVLANLGFGVKVIASWFLYNRL
jgi:hypothetical protein